jgi:hypothetical protein
LADCEADPQSKYLKVSAFGGVSTVDQACQKEGRSLLQNGNAIVIAQGNFLGGDSLWRRRVHKRLDCFAEQCVGSGIWINGNGPESLNAKAIAVG